MLTFSKLALQTRTHGLRFLPLLALTCLAAPGCREREIRAYTVPAERRTPAPSARPEAPAGAEMPAGEETPAWTLPEGWKQVPGSGIRFATVIVDSGDPPLEIRVTPLALSARDPLGNVNRWRDQIGLTPLSGPELVTVMRTLEVDGREVQLVNMKGTGEPPQQVLAAILGGDRHAWFFLMMGDPGRVSKQTGLFESFIQSVRLARVPEGHPPISATASTPAERPSTASNPQSGESMVWRTPPGWTQDAETSDMRVATFHLPGSAGEVAVTRFPGDVGGLLANVNRWRNQLSLPPVASPDEQPSENVTVAGQPALLFDLVQPGSGTDRERMMVVLLSRPDMTWFIKMTGKAPALDGQSAAFREFLGSVRLEDAAR